MTSTASTPSFATYDEARDAFWESMEGEDYCDNFRFAFEDDAAAVAKYEEQRADGCCGSTDRYMLIGGRLASMGCNYGH